MSGGDDYSRRHWLAGCGAIGVATFGGCLRLIENNESGDGGNESGETENRVPATDREGVDTNGGDEISGVELAPIWSKQVSAVAAADDDFFIRRGFTELLRVQPDGREIFTTEFGDDDMVLVGSGRSNTLAADDSGIYVGSSARKERTGARMYALDPETGDQQWSYQEPADNLHDGLRAGMQTDDLILYASQGSGSGDDQEPIIRALDPVDGEEQWHIRREGGFVNGLAVAGAGCSSKRPSACTFTVSRLRNYSRKNKYRSDSVKSSRTTTCW